MRKKVIPVRLLCIMQVLGQNANGTHDCLAHIKASRSLDDAVDHDVDFPAEHPVQRLQLQRLRDAVPRQDELSVGALKDWGGGVESRVTTRTFTSAPANLHFKQTPTLL